MRIGEGVRERECVEKKEGGKERESERKKKKRRGGMKYLLYGNSALK